MTYATPASVPPQPPDHLDRGASDRARLLHLLDVADDEPLTIAQLRDQGVDRPGQAIYELELDGVPIERVHRRCRARACAVVGFRLRTPGGCEPRDGSDSGRVSR